MRRDALSEALRERYGLAPRGRWHDAIDRAVASVAERHGIGVEAGPAAVMGSPQLMRELAEAMMVGESYFFRHAKQLEVAADVLAARLSRGEGAAAWSAGCCRGEEPYSLAILLDQRLEVGDRARVRLLASDIHAASVEAARGARYSEWSLRGVSREVRHDYFVGEGGRQLRARVRSRVELTCAAARDHAASLPADSLDVVLFRNVALYLTEEALRAVYAGFERVLRPGGLLVIAPSDPPPLPSLRLRFEPCGTGLYRRTGVSGDLSHPGLAAQGVRAGAEQVERPLQDAEVRVRRALALADRGLLDAALRVLDEVTGAFPRNLEARRARAEVLFAAHRFDEVVHEVDVMRLAGFDDATSRYLSALGALELGRRADALSQLRALARDLGRGDPDALLTDRSARTGELLAAVEHEIARLA